MATVSRVDDESVGLVRDSLEAFRGDTGKMKIERTVKFKSGKEN